LNCLKHHKTIFFFAKFIDIRKIWWRKDQHLYQQHSWFLNIQNEM
jgi:hypothetical protein